MVFPLAFMANTFAMMLVMIGLSLFGKPELAADLGLVHGATVALFYSFSGNARSLILGESGAADGAAILRLRLILLLPLAVLSFALCIGVVGGGWLFILLLVGRRAAEWLAELFLSEQELRHQGMAAMRFLLIQGVLSLVLLLALLGDSALALPMLLAWALSPLLGCMRLALLGRALSHSMPVVTVIRQMLPHFGSTAVIGVSVYVFRLFILLVAGKEVAGDLFSAFALGGILGAVFSQALGPTMVRQERSATGSSRMLKLFSLMLVLVALAGCVLLALVWSVPHLLAWTQKSQLFWLAVGCSLVGGVVMVLAQRIRLRILQDGVGGDVFGSDMLANILLVVSIPFVFYGLGVTALALLYLLGAMLSWVFYASEYKGLFHGRDFMFRIEHRFLLPALTLMLFAPIFFQLARGLYSEQSSYFSSGGSLALLPVPLSVVACYAGIVLLGDFARARCALVTVFLIFMGMLLSTVLLASDHGNYERAKMILLVQYMLPMFALVLGQQFGSRQGALNSLSTALFWLLIVIIPLQLISTFSRGLTYLSPSLFVFSIYQHLQYVPVLLVGAFLIVLLAQWEQSRLQFWLLPLTTLMGIYAAVSVSMLTMGLLLCGVICFTGRSLALGIARRRAVLVTLLAIGSLLVGLFFIANANILAGKLGMAGSGFLDMDGGGPKNIQERLVCWRFYLAGIGESSHSLLLGHLQAPDRNMYPSAHNYYLDFIYNFGVLAILPILCLLGWTLYQILRNIKALWGFPAALGLAGVVVFLLLADNAFKVGMRQPYPGIIVFFLWGVLLACLQRLGIPRDSGTQTSLAVNRRVEQ
jgi:hypothetical protein